MGHVWESIDHIVITCADIERSIAFYGDDLGMGIHRLDDGRVEVRFGRCKMNLQPQGKSFGPPRNAGRRWSANVCILAQGRLEQIESNLREKGVRIEEGPVERVGALGRIRSLYFYDPDDNLVEIAVYPEE